MTAILDPHINLESPELSNDLVEQVQEVIEDLGLEPIVGATGTSGDDYIISNAPAATGIRYYTEVVECEDGTFKTVARPIFPDHIAESIVDGMRGSDIIFGTDGDDFRIYGGADDDFIYGGDGDDFLGGSDGNDTVIGGRGDDTIRGGGINEIEGCDLLVGGEGDDTIYLGSDEDTAIGGEGSDTFVFQVDKSLNGIDTIVDFEEGIDKIKVLGAPSGSTLSYDPATGQLLFNNQVIAQLQQGLSIENQKRDCDDLELF